MKFGLKNVFPLRRNGGVASPPRHETDKRARKRDVIRMYGVRGETKKVKMYRADADIIQLYIRMYRYNFDAVNGLAMIKY